MKNMKDMRLLARSESNSIPTGWLTMQTMKE